MAAFQTMDLTGDIMVLKGEIAAMEEERDMRRTIAAYPELGP